jgi:RND family efflux transporter MFP subunit
MRERFIALLSFLSKPSVALGGSLVIGVIVVGIAWHGSTASPSGKYVSVTSGPITAEVDVSGVVKAAHSTDLSFQTSGTISSVPVQVGDHVGAGQTLVMLSAGTQVASVALAKANLEAQQAKLAALVAGTRPEEITIDQTAVTQAENALVNALASAYTNADDAVHAKADQTFTNPRTSNAQLSILVPDQNLVNKVQMERIALEPVLTAWKNTPPATQATFDSDVVSAETDLKTTGAFLDDLTAALAEAQPSNSNSAQVIVGYQTEVNLGRLNVSNALSALIGADTAYTSATGALTLAQAGATANDIAAQQAAVDGAQASLDAANAVAAQTVIAAPTSGTITVQNATLGQTVVPGVPVVSMIADGKYEADAEVSETDIATVQLGDVVNATFDAYPGVIFPATVTTVNPAADMSTGVASYGITVTFTNNDPRLKPGLSANLAIITATKDMTLLVPTSAIITNGNAKFVYVQSAHGVVQTSVATGITSATSMTEITSGLTQGEQVLEFGASAAPQQ